MVGTVNDSTLADGSFEYEVIGEHLTDPLRLLTIDGEGRLFDLNLETCSASPTELTEDWVVDVVDTSQYRRQTGVNAPLPALVVGYPHCPEANVPFPPGTFRRAARPGNTAGDLTASGT